MRRLTMLMNAVAINPATSVVQRTAGFTDSWYQSPGDSFDLLPSDLSVISLRAAMLPNTSSIVGARVADVDAYGRSIGRSRTYRLNVLGGQSLACADPRKSLIYDIDSTGVSNELALFIQNVPDARVVTGGYSPNAGWLTAIQNYIGALAGYNYGFFGYNLALAKYPVVEIKYDAVTELATVETDVDHPYAVGQFVRFLRTSAYSKYAPNPNGHKVISVIDARKFKISGWRQKDSVGGLVTGWAKIFCKPSLTVYGLNNPLVGSKKVGKPFFQYRGRASKHRISPKDAASVDA